MPDTRVELDLECWFRQGDPLFTTLLEGRDTVQPLGDELLVQVQEAPDVSTEYIVHKAALNYVKSTKRTITVEPEIPG